VGGRRSEESTGRHPLPPTQPRLLGRVPYLQGFSFTWLDRYRVDRTLLQLQRLAIDADVAVRTELFQIGALLAFVCLLE
jgi:hypothetical protein